MEITIINIVLAFSCALLISFLAIPSIIKIAEIKKLVDTPDSRKSHNSSVPILGGVAIFIGWAISTVFWSKIGLFPQLQFVFAAVMIVFMIGIKDDIFPLTPLKKMAGQILAAVIIVHPDFGNIRIDSFGGVFGIHDMPFMVSFLFSVFTVIVITNAFNLIDGVNLLASSLGLISAICFGLWFAYLSGFIPNLTQLAITAFSLVGAILGFMYYNKTPARIFMGDAGSLIIGLLISTFAILFIQLNPIAGAKALVSAPVVALSIISIPLFDTLRAFTIRVLNGHSPFRADKNHLHHKLLELNISHNKTTFVLVMANLLMIVMAYYFTEVLHISSTLTIISLLTVVVFLGYIPSLISARRRRINGVDEKVKDMHDPKRKLKPSKPTEAHNIG